VTIEGVGASDATVRQHAGDLEKLLEDHRESSETVADGWKRAEEAQVNKWALKVVLNLRRQSADKCADRRRALLAYLDWLIPEEIDLVDLAERVAEAGASDVVRAAIATNGDKRSARGKKLLEAAVTKGDAKGALEAARRHLEGGEAEPQPVH
jgi:hypothetical protein